MVDQIDELLSNRIGGRSAWLTVLGGYLCLFCSFGTRFLSFLESLTSGFINAIGVFQTYYEQNQLADHTPFQIGWILSFVVFFMNLGVKHLLAFWLMGGNNYWTSL